MGVEKTNYMYTHIHTHLGWSDESQAVQQMLVSATGLHLEDPLINIQTMLVVAILTNIQMYTTSLANLNMKKSDMTPYYLIHF